MFDYYEWPTKILTTPLWSLSCSDLNVWFWCWQWSYKLSTFVFPLATIAWALASAFTSCTALRNGVMSVFVYVLSTAIAWALTSTVAGSTALRKGPQTYWPHCHALMLMYQNSLWWRTCEHCNNFSLPIGCHCSLQLNCLWQHGHHMKCTLIGASCEPASYIRMKLAVGTVHCLKFDIYIINSSQ